MYEIGSKTRPPIILDIEASGFGAESYPIEIGVVLNDGTKYCSLILTEPQMEIWHATKDALLDELRERRHRASFDAYIVQETWERTWNATAPAKVATG